MVKIAKIWIAASLLFTLVAGNGQIDFACPTCRDSKLKCCSPAVCTDIITFSYGTTTLTVTTIQTTIITEVTVVPTSHLVFVEICSYRPPITDSLP